MLDYLARTTGLAAKPDHARQPLDAAEVEAAFAERVIGQPAATRAAADVVLKVRAGLADPGRPVVVMLFTGPTGTGKTELATAIAEYLYGERIAARAHRHGRDVGPRGGRAADRRPRGTPRAC